MGRAPCCEKDSVKRGPWTPEEDAKLLACIAQHGTGSWRTLPKKAGLQRCGKSCRLRWTNYLRPDLKHGRFSDHEEQLIVKLHAALGSRWSLIAAQLPGRTDNDVKNYWNTRLKKKLCEMGIDPITHKPISQLLADLAGSVALPKGGQIAEAALGCFKDDMLNVLMRKRPDWQLEGSVSSQNPNPCFVDMPNSSSSRFLSAQKAPFAVSSPLPVDPVAQKIKQSLSSAVQSRTMPDQADFYTQEEIPIQMGANRSNFAPKQSEFYNQFFLPGSKPMAMAPDSSYLSSAFLNSSKLGLPFGSIREAPSPNWDEELSGTSAAPAPNTSLHLHMGSAGSIAASEAQNSQIFLQQQESDSVSCQSLAMEVPPECQEARIPWSPSSGSSCSSTSLAFEGVLSSDVQLWDFSELSSIMS